jgi:hypothetical protein
MATRKKTSKAKRKPARKKVASSVTLKLDPAFYPLSALEEARQAFSHLATIELRKGKQPVVTFSGMSASLAAKLPDEFANFALCRAVVSQ